jgi:hypothetical protein
MSAGMNGANAGLRGVPLTSKVIAEVEELHERCVQLERDSGGRGRKARHELRGAREAESDLLRVLGFDSYGQFTIAVEGMDPSAEDADQAAAMEEPQRASQTLDAQKTEAELLRVINDLHADARDTPDAPGAPDVVEVVIVAEVRDAPAEPGTDAIPELESDESGVEFVVAAAAAALLEATQELRALGELLRDERAELAALGARSRATAEEILEEARADAQRIRDEAAAEARAELEQARAAAIELTRNAVVTVDGLRNLAAEDDTVEL